MFLPPLPTPPAPHRAPVLQVRSLNSQIDVLLTPASQKVRGMDSIEEEERELVAMRKEMMQVTFLILLLLLPLFPLLLLPRLLLVSVSWTRSLSHPDSNPDPVPDPVPDPDPDPDAIRYTTRARSSASAMT